METNVILLSDYSPDVDAPGVCSLEDRSSQGQISTINLPGAATTGVYRFSDRPALISNEVEGQPADDTQACHTAVEEKAPITAEPIFDVVQRVIQRLEKKRTGFGE